MPATPSPQHAATADTHRADGQTDRQCTVQTDTITNFKTLPATPTIQSKR